MSAKLVKRFLGIAAVEFVESLFSLGMRGNQDRWAAGAVIYV